MQIETRNYQKRVGRYSVDSITEFSVVLDTSLNIEEFDKLLEEAKINLFGWVTYAKKLLTYKNGKQQYKHIVRCAMSID